MTLRRGAIVRAGDRDGRQRYRCKPCRPGTRVHAESAPTLSPRTSRRR
ncbi:transposase-like zinc-binding domain-containing protein [Longimycelium tulufanense]